MPDLETFLDVARTDLGTPTSKPTSTSGNQLEAAKVLFTSEDGLVEIGVWECTPGNFDSDKSTLSEICHIISGKARLDRKDGEVREVGPGDVLVLPRGWKGCWTIVEPIRKLYVIHKDAT